MWDGLHHWFSIIYFETCLIVKMFTIYISINVNAQYSSEYTRKVQSKWRSRKIKRLKLKFLFSRERK